MSTFDTASYRVPTVTVATALGMSRALITSHSREAPPATRKAIKKVHAAAQALQTAWMAVDASGPARDARPADQALDNTYAALYGRLDSWRMLPAGHGTKQSSEADRLIGLLFPTGLGFLKLPFTEEWAESEKRLRRIEDDGLGASLDDLCGAAFLVALRATHKEYGAVLGITKVDALPDATGVADPLKTLVSAVQQYVRVVGGTVDDDDEASIVVAQALLRPIETMRNRVLANRVAGARTPAPVPGADPVVVDPAGGTDAPDAPIPSPVS
jgi:hypothetical protein